MERSLAVRYLYTFLFYLALPLIFIRLLWRSRREPAYRARILERLGFYSFKYEQSIWVHAVSVGEAIAAIPLIESLLVRYPQLPLVVTTMTPTGAARVQAVFGDRVRHAYLPYDMPDAMRRFLKTTKPIIAIMMETELWPNMLAACKARRIPVCLLNARLSAKSARGYGYVASLTRNMLSCVTSIAANGVADAARFIALGANASTVHVTGNIKFDIDVPGSLSTASNALRDKLGKDRFIWIAASTHEGEEEIILAAHKQLLLKKADALLILVPRHQSRFALMAKRCASEFATVKRSDISDAATCQNAAVFLGDSMGELMLFYSVADLVFVGGSLIPRGGHNFVEPAVLSKAMLVGPHVFNFADMFALFLGEKAIISVTDQAALTESLLMLADNPTLRADIGKSAQAVVAANRGALARQLALVDTLMKVPANATS